MKIADVLLPISQQHSGENWCRAELNGRSVDIKTVDHSLAQRATGVRTQFDELRCGRSECLVSAVIHVRG